MIIDSEAEVVAQTVTVDVAFPERPNDAQIRQVEIIGNSIFITFEVT